MKELKLYKKLKEAYETTTKKYNRFKEVIESIKWDNTFSADGEQYFIKDNNSTNHTFVNGTMIPVNQNVEIFDGDALMLANEPFEFHIN